MKLNVLVDAGIRTFIDLTTTDDHLRPYQQLMDTIGSNRGLHLVHRSFPIPDNDVAGDAHVRVILAAIDRALVDGPVYVHCWGGVGRTGTVIGCRLADQGLNHQQVLDRLSDLRAGTLKADRSSPEVPSQRAQIKRWSTA